MKKFALAIAALGSLGLAACGDTAPDANTAATNVEVTTENAVEDVTAAENAVNAADTALENVVVAADNAAANAQ